MHGNHVIVRVNDTVPVVCKPFLSLLARPQCESFEQRRARSLDLGDGFDQKEDERLWIRLSLLVGGFLVHRRFGLVGERKKTPRPFV